MTSPNSPTHLVLTNVNSSPVTVSLPSPTAHSPKSHSPLKSHFPHRRASADTKEPSSPPALSPTDYPRLFDPERDGGKLPGDDRPGDVRAAARHSINMLPPSPPLTETEEEDMDGTESEEEEEDSPGEADITSAWYADEHNPTQTLFVPPAEHPLQIGGHTPSPPMWEVMQPQQSSIDGNLYHDSRPVYNFESKLQPARPLIPFSSYYFGPPPPTAAYGTAPIGQIGVHFPREVVRIERDYSGGELVQFSPTYPLELEGRITPTQFLETINAINEMLISAHSLRHSFLDNALTFFSMQLSRLFLTSHYDKEMRRLRHLIDELNTTLYNPAGLNILWPRKLAFMFLEIEYY